MKNIFAVSNIGWNDHDDPAVLSLLTQYGVTGIEIAPSKVWKDLESVTERQATDYRKKLADHGFCIPAFQAILFGCPDLQVFDPATHAAFAKRLDLIARLAGWMGAKVLVFGAPKNRKRNGLAYQDAFQRAAEFFHQAGEQVKKYGCVLGIEANPVEYQCDFITSTADAALLVKASDSEGVRLHIDTGATALTHEDTAEVLRRVRSFAHYHISEPMLANPASGGVVDHASAFRALKELGYEGAVSIEMKTQDPDRENLEAALRKIRGAMNDAGM